MNVQLKASRVFYGTLGVPNHRFIAIAHAAFSDLKRSAEMGVGQPLGWDDETIQFDPQNFDSS